MTIFSRFAQTARAEKYAKNYIELSQQEIKLNRDLLTNNIFSKLRVKLYLKFTNLPKTNFCLTF